MSDSIPKDELERLVEKWRQPHRMRELESAARELQELIEEYTDD